MGRYRNFMIILGVKTKTKKREKKKHSSENSVKIAFDLRLTKNVEHSKLKGCGDDDD